MVSVLCILPLGIQYLFKVSSNILYGFQVTKWKMSLTMFAGTYKKYAPYWKYTVTQKANSSMAEKSNFIKILCLFILSEKKTKNLQVNNNS